MQNITSLMHVRRKKKRVHEIADLEAVGREMKTEFESQLIAIVPHIYHRPSRVLPSVEHFLGGRWFWQRRRRILLSITLSSAKDLSTIKPMIRRFANEYLAKPGNRRYEVRIFFPPIKKHQHEGEAR